MPVLRCGLLPLRPFFKTTRVVCTSGALVLLAGCAADKPPSYVGGSSAQQFAAAQARKVEMEDDGQPVQSPPVRSMRAEDDDPSQPWSPNYGGPAEKTAKVGRVPAVPNFKAPSPYIPTQVDAGAQPVTVRRISTTAMPGSSHGTLTRLSNQDADLIMAQAINAHEMRRQ